LYYYLASGDETRSGKRFPSVVTDAQIWLKYEGGARKLQEQKTNNKNNKKKPLGNQGTSNIPPLEEVEV
jgi:hypothetical protein